MPKTKTLQSKSSPIRGEVNTIPLSHKAFQSQVVHLAKLYGYEQIYHTWNSRHSPAGFPDLIIIKAGRQIVAELKIGKDNLSAEQYFWLLEFTKIKNTEVYVFWPEDWEEIQSVITDFFDRRGRKEG